MVVDLRFVSFGASLLLVGSALVFGTSGRVAMALASVAGFGTALALVRVGTDRP